MKLTTKRAINFYLEKGEVPYETPNFINFKRGLKRNGITKPNRRIWRIKKQSQQIVQRIQRSYGSCRRKAIRIAENARGYRPTISEISKLWCIHCIKEEYSRYKRAFSDGMAKRHAGHRGRSVHRSKANAVQTTSRSSAKTNRRDHTRNGSKHQRNNKHQKGIK